MKRRAVTGRVLTGLAGLLVVLPMGTLTPARAAGSPAAALGCGRSTLLQPIPPANVPAAAPVSQGSCPGVRPGAIVFMTGGQCTFNFVFKGSDKKTYIGTAGHCALNDNQGESRWKSYRGPPAYDSGQHPIGHFVYGGFRWSNLVPTLDFALIQLNPGVRWSSQMCHFGGPDGMYQRHASTPDVLQFFGNSPMYRSILPARSAVAPNTSDANGVLAVGEAAPGDSGSGAIDTTGQAVGVLTGGHGEQINGTTAAFSDIVFARLDVGVARAQSVLHIKLSIQNAPVL